MLKSFPAPPMPTKRPKKENIYDLSTLSNISILYSVLLKMRNPSIDIIQTEDYPEIINVLKNNIEFYENINPELAEKISKILKIIKDRYNKKIDDLNNQINHLCDQLLEDK